LKLGVRGRVGVTERATEESEVKFIRWWQGFDNKKTRQQNVATTCSAKEKQLLIRYALSETCPDKALSETCLDKVNKT